MNYTRREFALFMEQSDGFPDGGYFGIDGNLLPRDLPPPGYGVSGALFICGDHPPKTGGAPEESIGPRVANCYRGRTSHGCGS